MDSFLRQLMPIVGKGTTNYSLYSIPAMWLLCLLPHAYGASLMKGRINKANPRAILSQIQAKEKKTDVDQMFLRAESCQQNGFENLPFFAAGILAANFAKLPSDELNTLAASYLACRVLFNIFYIFISSETMAPARSGAYVAGIVINWTLFVKAHNALNALR